MSRQYPFHLVTINIQRELTKIPRELSFWGKQVNHRFTKLLTEVFMVSSPILCQKTVHLNCSSLMAV